MKQLNRIISLIDTFQRQHSFIGFVYSVIKKYNQDNGGYLSVVITYYSFLSLFPMLVVLTSLIELLLGGNSYLKNKLISSAARYFPVIGSQIQNFIRSPKETGIALVVSLIITLYGARGVANAMQYSLSTLWYVPHYKNPSLINNLIRSLSIMVIGGLGLLISSAVSGFAAISGNAIFVRGFLLLASFLLLWLTFIYIFKLSIAGIVKVKQVIVGALLAAFGLQLLQALGGIIIVYELKKLSNFYGTFALVVGLLFWIYLQARILLYAVEVDVIRFYRLFPRSIQGSSTEADKVSYQQQVLSNQRKKH